RRRRPAGRGRGRGDAETGQERLGGRVGGDRGQAGGAALDAGGDHQPGADQPAPAGLPDHGPAPAAAGPRPPPAPPPRPPPHRVAPSSPAAAAGSAVAAGRTTGPGGSSSPPTSARTWSGALGRPGREASPVAPLRTRAVEQPGRGVA